MESTAGKVAIKKIKKQTFLGELFRRLIKEKPLGTMGAVIVLLAFLAGIFANYISPFGMNEQDLGARLLGPSAQHLLGTDGLGRDLLTRIIYGARISMLVGLGATTIGTAFAIILGLLSGFLGGKFDIVVQRFVDAWMSFPHIFLILTIMAVIGQGLWQVILVIGALQGFTGSRVVRSAVISTKENIYVQASQALGSSTLRILVRHILPNVMAPIIILFTVNMGSAILTEATISFLGFGIPPPNPSWGSMLSGSGRAYMLQNPWMAFWPGLALALVVYGINMLGDAMRDILDPRLRGGLGRYGSGKAKKIQEKLTAQ
ncbi:MAG: ABC transporter permease [Dehalococcoidales bacterium]|nr:ABC transporter permease [Dehalococcoidales bacterium]